MAPELSAHLLNAELTPIPELLYLERSGLVLLYPVDKLSTLSDRAGDIRIGWNVLRDELDLSEDGIPARIGVQDMIALTDHNTCGNSRAIMKVGEEIERDFGVRFLGLRIKSIILL